MTTFIRVLDAAVEDKATRLRDEIARIQHGATVGGHSVKSAVFTRDPESFSAIPGSPLAYWVSDRLRATFRQLPRFESDDRTAKCGMGTLDDFRFLRARHELGPLPTTAQDGRHVCWVKYVGPRQRSLAYADVLLLVNWAHEGRELKTFVEARVGSASRKIQSEGYYYRAGLTWPLRGSRFSAQAVPPGCVFSVAGKMAFMPPEERLFYLGLFNASVFDRLIGLFAGKVGGVQYEAGLIQDIPVPGVNEPARDRLSILARRAWSLNRLLDTSNETSHAFILPPRLNERLTGLDRTAIDRELAVLQGEIDDHAFALYGIGREDRAEIEASSFNTSEATTANTKDDNGSKEEDSEDEDVFVGATTEALVSWFVGVAFGRFDPRLAMGERSLPPEPEPFDALPSRSPGMWPEGEEPATKPELLVDDEGHRDDLTASVRLVAESVNCEAPSDLRGWLAREFFPLHIKMYSKSRRKAPIYWQLATPSTSYSIWLYYHSFTEDTLFRVQNDYVAPKLAHEERRLDSMTREVRDKATAAERRTLASQEALVEELRAFLDEVKRVAPLWRPTLDDGVIINFAPLWRLVPQHKTWQRELKASWDALRDGKYDWAHLAMHLWPERVVPKCRTDRSLAIAHGLEAVFWAEGSEGKWTARKMPTRSIDELVRERVSPAVKAALSKLLEALPAPTGNRRPAGRRHAQAIEGGAS